MRVLNSLTMSILMTSTLTLSKYIAPEGRCTVQYRVTSDNGITSGDESAQRATSDAIGTSDPVLDGTSLIRGDVQYAPKSWTCQFRQLRGVASESKWQHHSFYSL